MAIPVQPDPDAGADSNDASGETQVPSARRAANAASLLAESVFCTHLPGSRPSALRAVSATIAMTPIVDATCGPLAPDISAIAAPNPAASAAMEPGNAIQNVVHPLRNPRQGPYASRK